MRILILGVSGLIGHRLFQRLSLDHEVFGTLHKSKYAYGHISYLSSQNIIECIDVLQLDILKGVIYSINPEVIINCVGITKRKNEINSLVQTLKINALFPHELTTLSKTNNIRLIHFSTDCVFNGNIGNYSEESFTDAKDIYGRTKALGEISYENTLTIRSSFIGQELIGKTELLEWLLSQNGKKIKGYSNTFYSGVSTLFMSEVINKIIVDFPNLCGLYQLATTTPITKFELLCIAREAFNLDIDIIPDFREFHSPTLIGTKLSREIDLIVPSWQEMMFELARVQEFYRNI